MGKKPVGSRNIKETLQKKTNKRKSNLVLPKEMAYIMRKLENLKCIFDYQVKRLALAVSLAKGNQVSIIEKQKKVQFNKDQRMNDFLRVLMRAEDKSNK